MNEEDKLIKEMCKIVLNQLDEPNKLKSYFEWKGIFQHIRENYNGSLPQHYLRECYTRNFSWFIPVKEVVEKIGKKYLKDKKVLDVACGNGYLANALKHLGYDVTGLDIPIDHEDSFVYTSLKLRFIKPIIASAYEFDKYQDYDVIIMTWPGYCSGIAAHVAKQMKSGQILIYQGEYRGGCCATDEFFYLLGDKFERIDSRVDIDDLNEFHIQFNGIHDYWSVYRVK